MIGNAIGRARADENTADDLPFRGKRAPRDAEGAPLEIASIGASVLAFRRVISPIIA